jgi:hypothetical protein
VAAALVAGLGGAALSVATRRSEVTMTAAGTVEVLRGLDPAATAAGAGVLAALACGWGLAAPRGRARRAWRDARAVLVVPGVVLTAAAAVAGAVLLLPGPALPVTLALLSPLLGSALMLAVGGVPVTLALSLVTSEPVRVWLPSAAPVAWAGGLAVLALLAVLAGAVRGRREPRTDAAAVPAAAAAGAAVAASLAWVTSVLGVLPPGLGGDVQLVLAPLPAALLGAGLALLTGVVAARVSIRAGRGGPPGGQDDAGRADLARAKTSAITTTVPSAGSSPAGTVSTTREASPAGVASTSVAST